MARCPSGPTPPRHRRPAGPACRETAGGWLRWAAPRHPYRIGSVTFTEDGSRLAAFSGAETAQWDVTDRHARLLAAPSADNHVYLFDLTQPSAPVDLGRVGGFSSEAYAAAFSPDGQLLAASGAAGEITWWSLDEAGATEAICRDVGDAITDREWQVHLRDRAHAPPCG